MRGRRYYERQIDKLLTVIADQNDRIMFLSGRTWTQPPTDTVERAPVGPRATVARPEQYPDDHDWDGTE